MLDLLVAVPMMSCIFSLLRKFLQYLLITERERTSFVMDRQTLVCNQSELEEKNVKTSH